MGGLAQVDDVTSCKCLILAAHPHPSFSHENLLSFLLTTSLFQTSSKRFLQSFLPCKKLTLGLLCFVCPFSPGCPHAAVPAAGDDPISGA